MNMNFKLRQFSKVLLLLITAQGLLMLFGFKSINKVETDKTVMVYAAAGTMVAMDQVAAEFEKQTGCKVIINYASSSTLARQLIAGADFDVYISANTQWMDYVQENRLIDKDSRRDILSDRLVLIASTKSALNYHNMTSDEILLLSNGQISIGDSAHVPCGMYAKQALGNMGLWQSIQNRIIPTASARAAQLNVESGQCKFGIVYRAAALRSNKIKILAVFDEKLHSSIRFSAARASKSIAGYEFLSFLTQQDVKEIFTTCGFTIASFNDPALSQNFSAGSGHKLNQWRPFFISLKVAAVCTLVVAVPGILTGYVLARKTFPGRSLLNACVHLPMVIPPVVTGYLALLMLGKNSFIGRWIYETFGISIAFSWTGAVLVSAIMGFPLLVRSVKTAVEMTDNRYSDAANILGAGSVRTFLTITIPLATPGIVAGLILAFARSLGEFGATVTFAGNIPGKTQTLSLAIYNFTQIPGAESAAIRLVAVSVLLSFAAMFASELLYHKMKYVPRTD